MTIEQVTNSTPAALSPISPGAISLAAWAEEAKAANILAKALSCTPFAGSWRDDEWGATAAILKGAEIGLSPTTSLGAFDNIQGRPAATALTLRALVQSRGHDLDIIEESETHATARYRRAGTTDFHVTTYTIEDARSANLTGKDNWKKNLRAMLVARVTSKAARLVAADLILGIGYSAEEIRDMDDRPARAVTQEPQSASGNTGAERVRAAVQAAPLNVPEPEADGEDSVVTAEAAPPAPDGPTEAQLRKMGALLREAGVTDRDQQLAGISRVVGRPIGTRKDLTKAEAATVIDSLEQRAAVTAAADIVEAELVSDEDTLWTQIVAAGAAEGMTPADVEDDFARENGGLTSDSATVEQLQAYLEVLTRAAAS